MRNLGMPYQDYVQFMKIAPGLLSPKIPIPPGSTHSLLLGLSTAKTGQPYASTFVHLTKKVS
jgi:hypothetical protein